MHRKEFWIYFVQNIERLNDLQCLQEGFSCLHTDLKLYFHKGHTDATYNLPQEIATWRRQGPGYSSVSKVISLQVSGKKWTVAGFRHRHCLKNFLLTLTPSLRVFR